MRHSAADTVAAEAAEPVASGGDEPRGPFPRLLPWLLLVGGSIGLLAAAILLIEKIARLRDPGYVPSCSLNPIVSCGSVMDSPQGAAFGFPNPLIGVAGFAVVCTVGAGLLAGARFGRWFWLGLQAGVVFGVVFVHWLIYQTLYTIGALCPYCMVVWAVTIPIFLYVTLHNVAVGHLPSPGPFRRMAGALTGYHGVVLTVWCFAILMLIGFQFWYYWRTLL